MCGPTGRESLPFCEERVDDFYKLPIVFPFPLFFSFFSKLLKHRRKKKKKKLSGLATHIIMLTPP